MLDRSRFRVPINKLEKIELLARLRIISHVFKGIGLKDYPVISNTDPGMVDDQMDAILLII